MSEERPFSELIQRLLSEHIALWRERMGVSGPGLVGGSTAFGAAGGIEWHLWRHGRTSHQRRRGLVPGENGSARLND